MINILSHAGNASSDEVALAAEEDVKVREQINNLVAERKAGVFFTKYFKSEGGEGGGQGDEVPVVLTEGEVVAGHTIDSHKAVVVSHEIKNFRVQQAKLEKVLLLYIYISK